MLIRKLAYAILGTVIIAGAALAHDPRPKHGGQIVEAGDYHVEAVVKGTALEVFIYGHDDKPVVAKGFKGTAILVVQGKPVQVTLASRDGNVLSGTSTVELAAPIRGAIQITNAKNQTVQAKF
jgi:hypothetical protein